MSAEATAEVVGVAVAEGSKDGSKKAPKPRRHRPKKVKSEQPTADGDEKKEIKKSKIKCRYFEKTGECKYGDNCRFRHVPKEVNEEDQQESKASNTPLTLPEQNVIMPTNPLPRRHIPVKPVRIVLQTSQIGSDEQKKARQIDIIYFKRRFPGTTVSNLEDGKTVVKFTYRVSNPEWVFDVNTLTFILTLPPEHPIASATLDIEQGLMPSPLQIYLIKKFNDILKEKHDADVKVDSFEPMGKWFVRQIDKYILELFIVGLKRTKWLQDAHASGLKVTVFDKPEEPTRELTKPETLQKENDNEVQKENEEPYKSASDDGEHEEATQQPTEASSAGLSVTSSAPKSAQLKVTVNWIDSEQSVGTITFTSLSGAARCLRCATQEFFDVTNGKEQNWKCKKCSTLQSIRFESVLGHQNSNVFGHVYPKGCRPIDCILLSSKLKVACMNCSKDFTVEALPYGTPSLSWCRQCNAKIRFAIDSIIFQGQFNAIPEGEKGSGSNVPKKKNLKDDILLTPGQPLPKKGTCKHYGRSYRWFRFPCCGKLYPCDTCHADNEDHEMKLANRMVCGFCSTEQPFSKESCKHCKQDIIKLKTSFWEGGKGCRNQLAMSKNDNKKYKNSKLKTVPTKRTGAEAKQDKEKK